MPGKCRFCKTPLSHTFVDLGASPLSNRYLSAGDLSRMEPFYPLHAWVCGGCLLVQLEEFETPEAIFSDYAYFSSCSSSWLSHCRDYAENMIERLALDGGSLVMEIASNDGYLLQYFRKAGVPVLGIEPAANVAKVAMSAGIPTEVSFFGADCAARLAETGRKADLLIGNNVLAHVPDINSFVSGLSTCLKETGTVTMEFPHLLRLMEKNQFDTIYHEHFSYLSFITVCRIFEAHGLAVFDVDELPTHGGSLRIYARHAEDSGKPVSPNVKRLAEAERKSGLDRLSTYEGFGEKVAGVKRGLLKFLIAAKEEGKRVAGYGAPAKGNTLLNFCGVKPDLLPFTCDISPHKQGKFLPGTRIPIYAPERIFEEKPDYVLILAWNLAGEITEQLARVRGWGGRFFVPIPAIAEV